MVRQVGDAAAEGRRHRVEAGEEEQEADVEDLRARQPFAVDLRVHERAQEIAARVPLALVDRGLEVRVEAPPGPDPRNPMKTAPFGAKDPCARAPGLAR